MAVDMFLKLDGIKGESRDDKHKDEIDVLAWSWGMSQTGSMAQGGGGGTGKVNVQDLSVTKFIDKSSPTLMLKCAQGEHIKKGTLVVRKAGGNPLEYVKIELDDIVIASVSTGGSGGEERLTENVSLNFAKVKVTYTPQKDDGSKDSEVEMGWDIKAHKKV